MSLAEIEGALKGLNRDDLAKLATYVAREDKIVWDEQLEEGLSPGGSMRRPYGKSTRKYEIQDRHPI